MIKLVATDIDGTIVAPDKEFTDGVKKCINTLTEKDVKVVLVTGRMHKSAKQVAKQLNLQTPIISYQGGLIKDYNDQTLYQANLDSDYAKKIITWARNKNIHINLYIDDNLYVENDNEIIKYYVNGKHIDYEVCNFDELEIENVNKILAIDINNPDLVTSWVNELRLEYPDLYIVKSTPYFCEIVSCSAKKSSGVAYLKTLWNLKDDEVLTIGDQNNDIDLVQCGGIGVAMGNATNDLKKQANYITDTVENDGFVKAIEKFVLNYSF